MKHRECYGEEYSRLSQRERVRLGGALLAYRGREPRTYLGKDQAQKYLVSSRNNLEASMAKVE